jgi:hypothetical protein
MKNDQVPHRKYIRYMKGKQRSFELELENLSPYEDRGQRFTVANCDVDGALVQV